MADTMADMEEPKMTKTIERALLAICHLFRRLDAPARNWVLARLAADHRDMLAEERQRRAA